MSELLHYVTIANQCQQKMYGWELKFCSCEMARQRSRHTVSPNNLHARFHAPSSSHALVTAANLTNTIRKHAISLFLKKYYLNER